MSDRIIHDIHRQPISLNGHNFRLVSLVPSLTELLYDLGLGEQIVGRTKFCIHPAGKVMEAKKVGGTKNFNVLAIKALSPDLIICNKEENLADGVNELAKTHQVLLTDIHSLDDALKAILDIGSATKTSAKASEIVKQIQAEFAKIKRPEVPPSVAYIIWDEPMMVAAAHTFIDDMLTRAGFINAFSQLSRYPIITVADLVAAQPDFIFLSSEPFPFQDKHILNFQQYAPAATIHLADGELFSWYGSRLTKSAAYFRTLV